MLDFNDRILKSGGILLSRWGENRTTQRSWAIKMRVRHKYSKCQRVVDSLERVEGIEPSYSAWKAAALPLSYTRLIYNWAKNDGGGGWI